MINPARAILERLLGVAAGLPEPLPADPVAALAGWLDDARRAGRQPNPNAMTLATRDGAGRPSARVVLCHRIEPDSRSLTFFTNYGSRKASDLAADPRVALVFHWDHADRQARVEGAAERTSDAESDQYFQSRPLLKRLGAWASDQSRPLPRRTTLVERLVDAAERFAIGPADLVDADSAAEVPRPPHWGGFRVRIDAVELWQGHSARLHDRARWQWGGSAWSVTRLFP